MALTVAELMALLENVSDKTMPVEIEGCDCVGPAGGVESLGHPDTQPRILITRADEPVTSPGCGCKGFIAIEGEYGNLARCQTCNHYGLYHDDTEQRACRFGRRP